jgi:hypothetical protein
VKAHRWTVGGDDAGHRRAVAATRGRRSAAGFAGVATTAASATVPAAATPTAAHAAAETTATTGLAAIRGRAVFTVNTGAEARVAEDDFGFELTSEKCSVSGHFCPVGNRASGAGGGSQGWTAGTAFVRLTAR